MLLSLIVHAPHLNAMTEGNKVKKSFRFAPQVRMVLVSSRKYFANSSLVGELWYSKDEAQAIKLEGSLYMNEVENLSIRRNRINNYRQAILANLNSSCETTEQDSSKNSEQNL